MNEKIGDSDAEALGELYKAIGYNEADKPIETSPFPRDFIKIEVIALIKKGIYCSSFSFMHLAFPDLSNLCNVRVVRPG